MNITFFNETATADIFNSSTTQNGYDWGEDFHEKLRLIIDGYVKISICVLGIAANTINIVVFTQIGLSDSITIAFFALAIADLGFVLFTFAYQMASNLEHITALRPYVDIGQVAYIITFYAYVFVDTSTLITVFAAVQKCACVAIPLMFRNIFTRKRATVIVSLIYLAILASYIPLFIKNQLKPEFDEHYNRTRLTFNHAVRDSTLTIFHIFNRITIPFTAQVLVILSMIILTFKLQQAARLRHSMTGETRNQTGDDNSTPDKNQMSAKEIRAVRVVAIISAIFVACNLPDVVSVLYLEFSPGMGWQEYFTYRLVRSVQNSLAATNSTINIVVYSVFNLKYRNKLMTICGNMCCRVETEVK